MTKKHALDEHVARLADVVPAEFVRERNALAASLKKKDASLARAVRALPRPSPAAWALGRVARHHEDELRGYLGAVDELTAIQAGRKSGDLGGAIRAERGARQGIVRRATDELATAKVNVTPELRRRVADTLLAAATGAGRDELVRGRLRADLHPGGVLEMELAPAVQHATPAKRPHLRLVPQHDPASERRDAAAKRRHERAEKERALKRAAQLRAHAAYGKRVHAAERALEKAEAQLRVAREDVESRRAALDALKSEADGA